MMTTRLYFWFFAILAVAVPLAAQASETANPVAADKSFAIEHVTPQLRDACINDYKRKVAMSLPADKLPPMTFAADGELAFNDTLTYTVSTQLFWDNAPRGVAFVLPVVEESKKSSQIACFYALQDSGLKFQLSQRFASAS